MPLPCLAAFSPFETPWLDRWPEPEPLPPGAGLIQLIYQSQATVRPSPAELEAMLVGIRHRNRQAGVSGMLMSLPGRFVQCLEGPAAAVADVLARVGADPRHRALETLTTLAIGRRAFAPCDMACADAGGSPWLRLATEQCEAQLSALDLSPGLAYMKQVWAAR